jgi:hypothetical protein
VNIDINRRANLWRVQGNAPAAAAQLFTVPAICDEPCVSENSSGVQKHAAAAPSSARPAARIFDYGVSVATRDGNTCPVKTKISKCADLYRTSAGATTAAIDRWTPAGTRPSRSSPASASALELPEQISICQSED